MFGCIAYPDFPLSSVWCRFPDRGSGFVFRSVVQTDSTVVSKTSDFGSYPGRPAIALWCKSVTLGKAGNISGFDPGASVLSP